MSSRDTRVFTTSEEAAGSEISKPLAVGLVGPLCCCGLARPATTAAYAGPHLVGRTCRLLPAAGLPVVSNAADPSWDSGPGAGRLVAFTEKPSEMESSSDFLFHASCCGSLREG